MKLAVKMNILFIDVEKPSDPGSNSDAKHFFMADLKRKNGFRFVSFG